MYNALLICLYVLGLIYFYLYPYIFIQNLYIDENALLPTGSRPSFNNNELLDNFYQFKDDLNNKNSSSNVMEYINNRLQNDYNIELHQYLNTDLYYCIIHPLKSNGKQSLLFTTSAIIINPL